jgi:hypothetical protein
MKNASPHAGIRPGERRAARAAGLPRGSVDRQVCESKARRRMGGGTVSTTETKVEHDRPGIGNGTKTKTKETVERDAAGNVVRHEKKVDH